VEGVSFASIFGGQKTEVRDTAFSEFTRNGARGCSIRTSRFRYIEWRDHKTGDVVAQELYDHSQDPGENVNIAGEAAYASIRSHLAVQLEGRK
jgi:iduronate 2-sulfatase